MLWFYNLSFRSKLLLPLGAVIAVTLVVSYLNISAVRGMTTSTNAITQTYLPAVQLVLNADRDMHQALIAERALLTILRTASPDTDAARNYEASRKESIDQVQDRMAEVEDLVDDPQAERMLDSFWSQFEHWKTLTDTVAKSAAGGRENGLKLSFAEAESAFNTARDTIDQIYALLQEKSRIAAAAVDEQASFARYSQLVGNGVVLALLAIVALFLPPLVTRVLNVIRERVEDIAQGEGDLTQRISIDSRDELGQLAESFDRFMAKLQKTIGDVVGYTSKVAEASQQLSTISDDNKRLVAQQHNSVDMVVTAANEMSSAIQDVARSTAEAANESQAAGSHSDAGRRQLQQTIGAMTGLRESVEDAREVIAHLAEDAGKIASVLSIIQGIAEQTNLLALNAAIEAARAGEQGRGFAVVADEVRTLARRTQQSTRDIEATIEGLQKGVKSAVAAMEAGSGKADMTLAEAREAEGLLGAIAGSVQRINDMSLQIASAAEQQSTVTDDISQNMVTIGDQSRQVAATAEQTSGASAELAGLAAQLEQVVGQFKV